MTCKDDRKCIYLAGPISKGDLAHNIDQATAAFYTLAAAGLAPWCPHWSVYASQTMSFSDGSVWQKAEITGRMSHEEWLQSDLPWVARADAVLRLPGESTGADREVAHAESRGIPVFYDIESLLRWVKGAVCPAA